MVPETIIAACIGAAAGGGGRHLAPRFFKTDRDDAIAKYYRGVIDGLIEENDQLRSELREVKKRITDLEVAQDHPPAHLG